MDINENKIKALVNEVSLERDDDHYLSFNIKIGAVIHSDKKLSYDKANQMMKKFEKLDRVLQTHFHPLKSRLPFYRPKNPPDEKMMAALYKAAYEDPYRDHQAVQGPHHLKKIEHNNH